MTLLSQRVEVADELSAMEYAEKQGWTDGLPIVAPTPERVGAFLTYAGLEPDEEVGFYEIRNRRVNAEKVAINAVMAGCKPEYFPVVVAAIEAVMDHDFHTNHLASTSSPWPAFVVNGPIIEAIGLNRGANVLGPGSAANATIGRAISLTLANCLEARVGGVQQGVLGIPSRVGGAVIAEQEDTPWEPLSVTRGVPRGTSGVTAVPHFMGGPEQVVAYPPKHFPSARALASLIAEHFTLHNTASIGFTNLVLISPPMQRRFLADGWSKEDLRRYLLENVRVSLAKAKRTVGTAGVDANKDYPEEPNGAIRIEPEDYFTYYYLVGEGKDDFDLGSKEHAGGSRTKIKDFLIAVAGAGEGEMFASLFKCYPIAPMAVTKVIRAGARS
jgi:hypothetical protein